MQRRMLLSFCVVLMAGMGADGTHESVVRATLDNGLRVVIVRDPLAPVVTVEENYIAGGNETPAGFPGMAHAQEHMAFRGCAGVSADQIAAIYAQLGGSVNADTQQNITQYFVTVPAQDLEVALRLDSACMQDVQDSQEQWAEERGAIEQEVARDLSNPTYKFITRLNEDLFSGTPYAHDALGTKSSFDATTGGHAQEVLSGLVCAQQRHPRDRRRCRSGGDARQSEAVVRPHQAQAGSAAPGSQLAAGQGGQLHARQQSAL